MRKVFVISVFVVVIENPIIGNEIGKRKIYIADESEHSKVIKEDLFSPSVE